MKKLLLTLTLLLCLLLAGCSASTPAAEDPTEVPAESTEAPAVSQAPEEAAAQAAEPARAYLIVTVAGAVYEPIPLYEAGRYNIRRGDYVNVVEVTEDSIKMAESTCDNQDCVEQGMVSLENKSQRVLQNMIICLPNDVALELYTYEEMLAVVQGYAGGQAE